MDEHQVRSVIILGCTGSVGSTALHALEPYGHRFSVAALSAHSDLEGLARIARKWNCRNLCVTGEADVSSLAALALPGTTIYRGAEGLLRMLRETEADIVLNAISGAAGLAPSFAALESGKDLALSNKESVVMAGDVLFSHARTHGARIIPVDSEHSTLHALITAHGRDAISSLVITASGGPFRTFPIERMEGITVAMALAHPTWRMGPKISIDSATLANKGLEVLEAAFLFGFARDRIEVVIHPQSVVHSLVRMHNGALYAQLSPPDMALPVMAALADGTVFLEQVVRPLDLTDLTLSFSTPDTNKFPLLAHAFTCAEVKHGYPIAFNAANEVAVEAFVSGRVSFRHISSLVAQTLESDWHLGFSSLEEVLDIDQRARAEAHGILARMR